MKKLKELGIKKVTLRNLDEPSLKSIVGGITPGPSCLFSCGGTCTSPIRNCC